MPPLFRLPHRALHRPRSHVVRPSVVALAWLWLLALMVVAMSVATPVRAQSPQPALSLGPASPMVDGWAGIRLLVDDGKQFDMAQVLQHQVEFAPASGPHANLGPRQGAVWLWQRLSVAPDDDGRWLLDIDYPSLDRIDVYVLRAGRVVQQATLGDLLVQAERPIAGRTHAVALELAPGQTYELLLRVQTRSAMIVPLRLAKAQAFLAAEQRVQLLQGLAAGIGLCLVFYALGQWLSARDPMYLYFAATVTSIGFFFFAYFGLGPQYLWPGSAWLTDMGAPLFVLLSIASAQLLIERLLDLRATSPRMARLLIGLALLALLLAGLYLVGLLSYRGAQLAGTVLGPVPLLIGVCLAMPRALHGDAGARYLLAGWAAYAAGVLVMAGLLRGWIGADDWTQHAFQLGWICESLAWLRVLGVRTEAMRTTAERATLEREALHALAHTDALTGLPNRRGLNDRLTVALAQLAPGEGLAVYLIDLDGFKAVNDRLGHDAGDALLGAAGQRLHSVLRSHDVVARIGGDEFVVLARQLRGEADAWQLGEKMVRAFDQPFTVLGQSCRVGLTTGFALAPHDGCVPGDLLRRADAAMYAGKAAGKGTVRRGGASQGLAAA